MTTAVRKFGIAMKGEQDKDGDDASRDYKVMTIAKKLEQIKPTLEDTEVAHARAVEVAAGHTERHLARTNKQQREINVTTVEFDNPVIVDDTDTEAVKKGGKKK